MSEPARTADPYAPPRARLEATAASPGERLFFTASPLKLAVMSLATFNLYAVYWFWMNFRAIRARDASAIWPFARALFSPICAYSCFRRQGEAAPGGPHRAASAALALAYLFASALSFLPDPWWLVSMLDFVLLYPANAWARAANLADDPALEENARFDTANWLWMILGGLFTLLVLAGLFAPQAD